MSSFIKIDRKILKWEWYRNEHTKNVFFHCLLKACWEDTKIEGEIIPRGSFVSSIKTIAEELSLTPMEVRTALKHLKLTNEITSKGTNKNTLFTINNYNLYQAEDQVEQQTKNKQTTNKQQTVDKPLITNKTYIEDKELEEKKAKRKEKKEDNLQLFERIISNYSLSKPLSDKIREWIEYKIQKKDAYVEKGMNSLIKKISIEAQKNGDSAVMSLIDICMSNNWKGIIWDKLEIRSKEYNNISKKSQFEQLMEQIKRDDENDN